MNGFERKARHLIVGIVTRPKNLVDISRCSIDGGLLDGLKRTQDPVNGSSKGEGGRQTHLVDDPDVPAAFLEERERGRGTKDAGADDEKLLVGGHRLAKEGREGREVWSGGDGCKGKTTSCELKRIARHQRAGGRGVKQRISIVDRKGGGTEHCR